MGGRYFDVLRGSYRLASLGSDSTHLTLSCTYRVTTTLNGYSGLWADYLLDDFNQTILEVTKLRSEQPL